MAPLTLAQRVGILNDTMDQRAIAAVLGLPLDAVADVAQQGEDTTTLLSTGSLQIASVWSAPSDEPALVLAFDSLAVATWFEFPEDVSFHDNTLEIAPEGVTCRPGIYEIAARMWADNAVGNQAGLIVRRLDDQGLVTVGVYTGDTVITPGGFSSPPAIKRIVLDETAVLTGTFTNNSNADNSFYAGMTITKLA